MLEDTTIAATDPVKPIPAPTAPIPVGRYVLQSDYINLQDYCDALSVENSELRKRIEVLERFPRRLPEIVQAVVEG